MCLAIPGRLEERTVEDPVAPMGRVRFGGVDKTICLSCVPDAKVGDYLLVHAGLALNAIDEAEAQEIFRYLEEIGELAELEEGSP